MHADGSITDRLADGTRREIHAGVTTLYRADGTRASRVDGEGTTTFDAGGLPVSFTSTSGAHGHFVVETGGAWRRIMDDGPQAGVESTWSAEGVLLRTISPSGLVTLFDASGRRTAEIDESTGLFTRFVTAADGSVTGTRSDGRIDHYNAQGVLVGQEQAPTAQTVVADVLQTVTQPDGSFVVSTTDGTTVTFAYPDGRGGRLDADRTFTMTRGSGLARQEKVFHLDGTTTLRDGTALCLVRAADGSITGSDVRELPGTLLGLAWPTLLSAFTVSLADSASCATFVRTTWIPSVIASRSMLSWLRVYAKLSSVISRVKCFAILSALVCRRAPIMKRRMLPVGEGVGAREQAVNQILEGGRGEVAQAS